MRAPTVVSLLFALTATTAASAEPSVDLPAAWRACHKDADCAVVVDACDPSGEWRAVNRDHAAAAQKKIFAACHVGVMHGKATTPTSVCDHRACLLPGIRLPPRRSATRR